MSTHLIESFKRNQNRAKVYLRFPIKYFFNVRHPDEWSENTRLILFEKMIASTAGCIIEQLDMTPENEKRLDRIQSEF